MAAARVKISASSRSLRFSRRNSASSCRSALARPSSSPVPASRTATPSHTWTAVAGSQSFVTWPAGPSARRHNSLIPCPPVDPTVAARLFPGAEAVRSTAAGGAAAGQAQRPTAVGRPQESVDRTHPRASRHRPVTQPPTATACRRRPRRAISLAVGEPNQNTEQADRRAHHSHETASSQGT